MKIVENKTLNTLFQLAIVIGIVGIILWAIFLIFILKLADIIAFNRNILIAAPLMLISFYNLTNCALLSTILTHGLFLSFIIVYCLPKKVN